MVATTALAAYPAEDARHGHRAALAALRDAVARNAYLWRHTGDPGAPVPGLTWTAAETAAHVVGDLRDHTEALIRAANGYRDGTETGEGSPAQRSALANAAHLTTVRHRDLRKLASMLEEQSGRYLAAVAGIDESAAGPTPNGLVLTPPTMTALLLGEQLVHGLDIARAAGRPWLISHGDALSVIPGVLAVAPHYVHPVRSADQRVSFELRIRGGGRYRLAVHDGAAEITAAGERADCVITADPVAFLQLGYGRIPQWVPIVRGKLVAGGKKPWLATKFATLLTRP
jgi:hypothetical protein